MLPGEWLEGQRSTTCHIQLPSRHRRSAPAFSLIEMMMVVAIILIVASISAPVYQTVTRRSRRAAGPEGGPCATHLGLGRAFGRAQARHLLGEAVQAAQDFVILAAVRLRLLFTDKRKGPVRIQGRAFDVAE